MLSNMANKPLFLDTTVLFSGLSFQYGISHKILLEHRTQKYTNEFAIKELRKILKEKSHADETAINYSVDIIKEACLIVADPSREETSRVELTDKADKPIVCSAMKLNCILITEDRRLRKEAAKYVETKTPEELISGRQH